MRGVFSGWFLFRFCCRISCHHDPSGANKIYGSSWNFLLPINLLLYFFLLAISVCLSLALLLLHNFFLIISCFFFIILFAFSYVYFAFKYYYDINVHVLFHLLFDVMNCVIDASYMFGCIALYCTGFMVSHVSFGMRKDNTVYTTEKKVTCRRMP